MVASNLLTVFGNFVDQHIPSALLRKCGITKMVDDVVENQLEHYHDNPILHITGKDGKKSSLTEKTVSAKELLKDKLIAGCQDENVYQMFKSGTFFGDYKKDTYYRFDRLPKANWEKLQLATAKSVIDGIESETDDDHVEVLVFDDSLYQRRGEKGTDLCARVFDHVDRKMRVGFRMMTGGPRNGDTFIPFAQVLLSTRRDDMMVGTDDCFDRRTVRGKRRASRKDEGNRCNPLHGEEGAVSHVTCFRWT